MYNRREFIRLKPNIHFVITTGTKIPKPRARSVGAKVSWNRGKPKTCPRCHARLALNLRTDIDNERSCLMCGFVSYTDLTSVLDNRYGSAYR